MKAISRMPKNALTEQQALFVHHVEHGAAPASAAALAGFAAPHDAARRLMKHPAIRAHLMESAKALDLELENQSRFVLRSLLASDFTGAQIKARISLELLKRADKRDMLTKSTSLVDMSEAALAALIEKAQKRLSGDSPGIIDVTPDSAE